MSFGMKILCAHNSNDLCSKNFNQTDMKYKNAWIEMNKKTSKSILFWKVDLMTAAAASSEAIAIEFRENLLILQYW